MENIEITEKKKGCFAKITKHWVLTLMIIEGKNYIHYWDEFLAKVFAQYAIRFVTLYLIWNQIWAERVDDIVSGYNLNQLVEYYLIAPLIILSTQLHHYRTSEEIYQGTFNKYLIFPVPFFLLRFFGHLTYSFPFLCIMFSLSLGFSTLSIYEYMFFSLPIFFIAVLLTFIIELTGEMVAFWYEHVAGLLGFIRFVYCFFGGLYLPLSFLPKSVQDILEYSPFPYMINIPIQSIMGRLSFEECLRSCVIGAFWVLVCGALLAWMWTRGVRHYNADGN